MVKRILAFMILLLSILFMPFWVSAILAFAGMVYFSFFAEAVVLFFLSDLLYGAREAKFFNIVFVSLIISVLTLFVLEFLKKKIKFYP
ncbi:hypothetical protein A3A95_03835 [Candidatus Nomurabacteria bacterium RIFCSPLOWO2_01_FULL_39_18]|uniref:Uncharacterized protein n=1 Tax=Candidatus Nomurabacteria bacterium RIFCSPHIGHO2_01_FULL_40_24b TaxID=1801739 RepID=A0A1F6V642_9BACT|nr:MAG: hypothetical protein A2647_04685 [Candidatus Nomurabacteria bacterium RIFCSPHIGHO2_01_FULL_40_24b]OGI89237.1 MAG: hypothetical protein A3A95_03835 [Candidatus Nomurabacteria bacterium RIFCSPLOWO2_01_FULL_39_18]